VDAPGLLVPPDPTEVVLCTIPTEQMPGTAESQQEPRLRVLHAGAAEFAAFLNGLPDRNQVWLQWQRKHSGWWPDAAPDEASMRACLLMGKLYEHSFVLRYADRAPLALIDTCGTGGLTSGARTRIDASKPHVVDEFLRRFEAQR
jgi:hypothetical protein